VTFGTDRRKSYRIAERRAISFSTITRADVASTAWIIARVPRAGARQSRIGVGGAFREIARHQTLALYEDRIALIKLRCSRAMAMVQPWHSALFTVGP
jgi:hypothetical protein